LPEAISQKDRLERDWRPHGHSEYNLSIHVKKITVQPSKYKPVSLDPVELDILRLKRAVVPMDVKEDSKDAKITAIIEFRGKALTLSLTEGDCDVGQVAWRLSKFHYSRYGKAGLRILSPLKAGRLCDCTLENPDDFLNFLHLIQTNGGLTVRVSEQRGEFGIGQVESFKLGAKEYHVSEGQNDGAVSRKDGESKEGHEVRVELADRVYTPLLKEVILWKEPRRGNFSEWTRLHQEERLWVKKVPKPIVDLLTETRTLFESKGKLWTVLKGMIEDATSSFAPAILGRSNVENVTNFDFRLIVEGGGSETLYVLWIWESEKDLSNYIMDFIEPNYPPGTQWRLETWATTLPTGTVKLIGNKAQTRELINRLLGYLMGQQLAREFLRVNKNIKDHADRIISLIDAELEKD